MDRSQHRKGILVSKRSYTGRRSPMRAGMEKGPLNPILCILTRGLRGATNSTACRCRLIIMSRQRMVTPFPYP